MRHVRGRVDRHIHSAFTMPTHKIVSLQTLKDAVSGDNKWDATKDLLVWLAHYLLFGWIVTAWIAAQIPYATDAAGYVSTDAKLQAATLLGPGNDSPAAYDEPLFGFYAHNPFYVAGDKIGVFPQLGNIFATPYIPASFVMFGSIIPTTRQVGVEDAGESLLYDHDADGTTESYGSVNAAKAARPAYGSLQGFAQQFMHIEAIAERQMGVACRMAMPIEHMNGTASMSRPDGGQYCKFLEQRASMVEFWFRSIANSWRAGMYIISFVLFVRGQLFILKNIPHTLTWMDKEKKRTGIIESINKVALAAHRISMTPEHIAIEEFLLKTLLMLLAFVWILLRHEVVQSIIAGPDIIGYETAKGSTTFLNEGANNFFDTLPGMQRGRIFYSSYVIENAQDVVFRLIVLWIVHFIFRISYYYPGKLFMETTTSQETTELLQPVFDKMVETRTGDDDTDGEEHSGINACASCTMCCSSLTSHKYFRRMFGWLRLLRGPWLYQLYVMITLGWLFVVVCYVPLFLLDGFSRDDGTYYLMPLASLSKVGSSPESGGYSLAAVVGYPDDPDYHSALRKAQYDFHVDDTIADATHYGLTYPMHEINPEDPASLDLQCCTMCLDYCTKTRANNNNRLGKTGDLTDDQLKVKLQESAPGVLGLSMLMRYNAQLADHLISTSCFVTANGGRFVLGAFILLLLLKNRTKYHIAEGGKRDMRKFIVSIMTLFQFMGHCFVVAGALCVIFLAVPVAEESRDLLTVVGSEGVNLRASGYVDSISRVANHHNGHVAMENAFAEKYANTNGLLANCVENQNKRSCSFVGTPTGLTGAVTASTDGYPYKYAKNTGATVWQHAIGLAFQSDAECSTITSSDIISDSCKLAQQSFFRDSAFTTALVGATQHKTRHDKRTLLDAVMRPVAHETPGYYISNGDNNYKFSVNEAPLLAPEYQNDIRVLSFFVVFFSVAHLIVYHAMFGQIIGLKVNRSTYVAYSEGLQNVNSYSGSRDEKAPLVRNEAQKYQPTTLRMTGMKMR